MNAYNPSPLKGNLKTLLATGGFLAGAGAVSHAAIVYTDLGSGVSTATFSDSIYFNLTTQDADNILGNVSGGMQFRLYFAYGPTTPQIAGAYYTDGPVTGAQGFAALRLNAGETIGDSLSFLQAPFLAYNSSPGYQWSTGDRGYLALRINDGGTRYGWADVQYVGGGQLTLFGFAYDDSSDSILAGATNTVPEPATGAMAALVAGSFAAFQVRHRRKAASRKKIQPEPVSAN